MKNINTRYLRWGIIISLVCALLIFIFAFALGNEKSFLLLNADLGKTTDTIFFYTTFLGDGFIWLALFLFTWFLLKRKDALLLIVSTFLLSTIFVQLFKYIIAPDTLRPIKFIQDTSLIHTVPGVTIHTVSSFPSGHAATAFCIYLLLCMLVQKKWWLLIGLMYALLVSYSRIYLAQHFPEDIGGGIITAIVSVVVSYVLTQNFYHNKKSKKTMYAGTKIS